MGRRLLNRISLWGLLPLFFSAIVILGLGNPSSAQVPALFGLVKTTNPPIVIVLTTASVSPWSVPTNWNNANNKIECIGGGGAGENGVCVITYTP